MSDEQPGTHKLGDVLRTAREERGVDLARVERDTKIRVRYLTALETGDYRELPGAVYTKGFLRNYGSYLGLDPEYLIDLYRLETSGVPTQRVSVQPPPRPLTGKRARAFVLTPGAIVAAILTIGVVIFVVYFVNEFVTFARTPGLTISDPAGDVAAYHGTSYTVRGMTEPDSTITIQGARENPSVKADADGAFSVEVMLVPGSNVITLVASDPLTGRDSDAVRRTIVVVGAEPSASPTGALTVASPEDGAEVRGPLQVTGSAAPGATVTVSATFTAAAPPTFAVVRPDGSVVPIPDTPPAPPDPARLTVGQDGAFDGSLDLLPGTWELSISVEGGAADAVTRSVSVTAQDGLHGTLSVEGGVSYLEVDEDGTGKNGVSGRNAQPGTTVELSASATLRIRAGNAGAVTVTVNGIALGTMGGDGQVIEWRITRQ